MDRREWMGSVLGMSVAAGLAEAAPKKSSAKEITSDGRYPVVPLAQDSIRVGLVQTRFRSIDPDNVERSRKENLAYMLDWIDRAQQAVHHDVLMFHELPLTGLSMSWNRTTILKGCIEIPGVETEAIAQKARQHRCYVIFGAYVVDRDWPGHFVSATTMIGPDGRIVDSQWKARNIMGALGGIELMTTTIFNVLDRYVEMYGWDRVLPVARTPIGNIALSSVQLEPELFRAFGMKGAEIVLRTATGRYRMADMQGAPLHNGFWSAVVNNAYLPDDPQGLRRYWADGDWRKPTADSTNVLTTAFDARGNIVAQASDPTEQVVSFTIPIAAHRATARQPVVHAELYRRNFDAYVGRYPPSAFLRRQPSTVEEAAAMIKAGERWRP